MLLLILALAAGLLDRIAVALVAAAVILAADLILAANILGNRGAIPVGLEPFVIAMAFEEVGLTTVAGFLVGLFLRWAFLRVRRAFR